MCLRLKRWSIDFVKFTKCLFYSFEEDHEESGSEDNASGIETPIQVPSLVVSVEDINADLQVELIREKGIVTLLKFHSLMLVLKI